MQFTGKEKSILRVRECSNTVKQNCAVFIWERNAFFPQ